MDSRGVIRMNILFITCVDMNGQAGDSTHVREFILNLSKVVDSVVVLSPTSGEDTRKIDNVKFKKARLINIPFLMSPSFSIYAFIMGFYTVLTSKYDVIYERHSIFGTGCKLGKIFKIPCIVEVNGLMTDEQKMTGMLRRIITKFELKTFSQADTIVVVTAKIKETLKMDYGVPGNKIVVVENGANTDLFKPMDISKARKELKFDKDSNYVCFVGLLASWQGVEYLIQSAPLILKDFPNTNFLIVGDGPMKRELMELAEKTGVSDEFRFTGIVPYEEVPKYINASDVCVAPFVRARNERIGLSPLKIYEYLACGKPVVSSRIPNLEFIEKQNVGTLVEPENSEDLAEAIIKLLKDEKIREDMGKNGREYVVKNHSWESVARKVATVCEEAIEEHKNKKR